MPSVYRIRPELRSLASAQGGVLHNTQLRELGITKREQQRLNAGGILHPFEPGVHSLLAQPTWLGRAWAGLFLGGKSAVLGLEAAAHLHGFLSDEPAEIAVFIDPTVCRVPRTGYRFIRAPRTGRGDPCRTRVEDTVLDLCEQAAEDDVIALLANVVSSHDTTPKRLLSSLGRRPQFKHRRLLKDALGEVSTGVHSVMEHRYVVRVERPHGLPPAFRQAHVLSAHRTDDWYREYGLIVELDSKLHHVGAAAFEDMARDNEHALAGATTLRFGWIDVTDGACMAARLVGRALAQRGWPGPLTTCRNCRAMPL
jgi:hypothetical protein